MAWKSHPQIQRIDFSICVWLILFEGKPDGLRWNWGFFVVSFMNAWHVSSKIWVCISGRKPWFNFNEAHLSHPRLLVFPILDGSVTRRYYNIHNSTVPYTYIHSYTSAEVSKNSYQSMVLIILGKMPNTHPQRLDTIAFFHQALCQAWDGYVSSMMFGQGVGGQNPPQKKTVDIYLEPQTTIYKWLFQLDDSQSLNRKWLFHQTSIYKWLFGVPGIYIETTNHQLPRGCGKVYTPEN